MTIYLKIQRLQVTTSPCSRPDPAFTAEAAVFYFRDSQCNPLERHQFLHQGLVLFLFTRDQVPQEEDPHSCSLQDPI